MPKFYQLGGKISMRILKRIKRHFTWKKYRKELRGRWQKEENKLGRKMTSEEWFKTTFREGKDDGYTKSSN